MAGGQPRTFVAGHKGLVGSAIVRAIMRNGGPAPLTRSRQALDLMDARAVSGFFQEERPDVVYMAAAKVGGIMANDALRWDFLYENLRIEAAVLGAALEAGVRRVVFFGSSCIYPRLATQPIEESELLTGALEPTNEPYAIAKIAGVKLVEAANEQYGRTWVSLMPTNLYGPGDNFDLQASHVLPAMIRKFHEARVAAASGSPRPVVLWGSGTARREFLYVDDLAAAALHVAASPAVGLMNVGYGTDITIGELADIIADVIGYDGAVEWDSTKPDGTPRKLLASSRVFATGWEPVVDLRTGIRRTYDWYLAKIEREHGALVTPTP